MKDIKNKVQLIFTPNILEGWSGALFWGLYPSLSGIIQNAKRHQYGGAGKGNTGWCRNQFIITMRSIILPLFFIGSFTTILAQTTDNHLKITQLTGDFYMYTTYNLYEGSKIPANGMYLLTSDGAVLFDTPWDTTQFQPLLDSIRLRHQKSVVTCFATHWHSDKTAGLEYYRQQGIRTYTTVLTDQLSKKNNKKRAEFLMTTDTVFQVGQYTFETYYPGPGHTEDNIVIWFEKEKVLYSGCLIKGAKDDNLGYLGDGNVKEYASSLKRVRKKCRHPKFITVAHSDWRDTHSLKHSLKMAKALRKKKR